jgi:hypothetical protein
MRTVDMAPGLLAAAPGPPQTQRDATFVDVDTGPRQLTNTVAAEMNGR